VLFCSNRCYTVFLNAEQEFAAGRRLNPVGQVIEQRELRADDITSVWNVNALVDGMYFFEIQQSGEDCRPLGL
jgi:hypothetical protein